MHEERKRSLAKGITWRILATSDTVILALIFTGSVSAALSIGGLELLTKTAWYYVHERAWLHAGTQNTHPTFARFLGNTAHARSVLKAVTWRLIGAVDTFIIALLITGHLGVSSAIGGAELITKVTLYYLHERLWLHIHWGTPAPENNSPFPDNSLAQYFEETLEILRRYYHLGAALFYVILCVLFMVIFAAVIFAFHSSTY